MPASTTAPLRASGRSLSSHHLETRTRLWLEFVNTDSATESARGDLLRDFGTLVRWLVDRGVLDTERATGLSRRALLQPAAATAALLDARRVRGALRELAEHGAESDEARREGVIEINRVLGRSVGMRRLEQVDDGSIVRVFIPTGDAYAGLMIPVVESAADALTQGEVERIHRCSNPGCRRVFLDTSRSGTRRWCDMGTCGNRAKAARFRARARKTVGEAR